MVFVDLEFELGYNVIGLHSMWFATEIVFIQDVLWEERKRI